MLISLTERLMVNIRLDLYKEMGNGIATATINRAVYAKGSHCHYQNGELTMKSKAHPFISRISFLFRISGLFL